MNRECFRMSFAMARQPGSAFRRGNWPKTIHANEESRPAVELYRTSKFARHTHGIPQRVELFAVVGQYHACKRAALRHDCQFKLGVGKNNRRIPFERLILEQSLRPCDRDKSKYRDKPKFAHAVEHIRVSGLANEDVSS